MEMQPFGFNMRLSSVNMSMFVSLVFVRQSTFINDIKNSYQMIALNAEMISHCRLT